MDHVLNIKLHNYFDIEVSDAQTGKIKQTAKAYNHILNQGFNFLCNLVTGYKGTFGAGIAIGDGSGTLDVARTDLFHRVYAANATLVETLLTPPTLSSRKYIRLNPEQYVGTTFTEVGLTVGSSPANGQLMTHALLEDSEGNPISILKTETDVLTIYATQYVVLDLPTHIKLNGIETTTVYYNDLITHILGLSTWFSFLGGVGSYMNIMFTPCRPKNLEEITHLRTISCGVVMDTTKNIVFTPDYANKKAVSNILRTGIDASNNKGMLEMVVANGYMHETYWAGGGGGLFSIFMPGPELDHTSYTDVPLTVGTAVQTIYELPYPNLRKDSLIVKKNGTPITNFSFIDIYDCVQAYQNLILQTASQNPSYEMQAPSRKAVYGLWVNSTTPTQALLRKCFVDKDMVGRLVNVATIDPLYVGWHHQLIAAVQTDTQEFVLFSPNALSNLAIIDVTTGITHETNVSKSIANVSYLRFNIDGSKMLIPTSTTVRNSYTRNSYSNWVQEGTMPFGTSTQIYPTSDPNKMIAISGTSIVSLTWNNDTKMWVNDGAINNITTQPYNGSFCQSPDCSSFAFSTTAATGSKIVIYKLSSGIWTAGFDATVTINSNTAACNSWISEIDILLNQTGYVLTNIDTTWHPFTIKNSLTSTMNVPQTVQLLGDYIAGPLTQFNTSSQYYPYYRVIFQKTRVALKFDAPFISTDDIKLSFDVDGFYKTNQFVVDGRITIQFGNVEEES